jgi:hypothetical protein
MVFIVSTMVNLTSTFVMPHYIAGHRCPGEYRSVVGIASDVTSHPLPTRFGAVLTAVFEWWL